MKKIVLNLFFILFGGIVIFAQSDGFKYQAVLRNSEGAVLQNKTVGIRISILQGSETGSSVYTETHTPTTNDFGLVNITIGDGTVLSGSFSDIPWESDNFWVKIEIDETGGTNYLPIGTSKLLSVPYSIYSKAPWATSNGNIFYNKGNVGIGTSDPNAKFEIRSTGFTGDTLFCVKDIDGRPVFIVYPDGVQVIVDTTDTKSGASGRFLVSGRGLNKNSKGTEMNFMDLTKKNYLIGNNVAPNINPTSTTGIKNSILGYEAGHSLVTGYQHTFIGYKAGYNSLGGNSNIFIGNNAGLSTVNGIGNIYIGLNAGYSNNHSTGSNVFIGQNSGYYNTDGKENVYVGYQVGANGQHGIQNVYIGAYTGKNNSGSSNVFIGPNVGSSANTSNKLYIDNEDIPNPLIWGDFANDSLKVFGYFNINGAYTFPKIDGTSGQVLKTDGNGHLSWNDAVKSYKPDELNALKTSVKNQQQQIEKLLKENEKIKNDNKNLELRIKNLEKLMNKL